MQKVPQSRKKFPKVEKSSQKLKKVTIIESSEEDDTTKEDNLGPEVVGPGTKESLHRGQDLGTIFFLFKRVLDRGPEQRESKMTVLCLLISIYLYIIVKSLIMEKHPS